MNSGKVQPSGSKHGLKRKLSELEEDDKSSADLESSPTKEMTGSQSSDSASSTPVKSRLEFDFWKDSSPKPLNVNATTTDILIGDINKGNYLNQLLRFRITYKSEMKNTTIGSVFSFHGIDKSGEISIVAFREDANKLYENVKVNNLYSLVNFTVKEESQEYRSGTGNVFEIAVNSGSILAKIEDEYTDIPQIPFDRISIKDIHQLPVKTKIDLFGVIVSDWGTENTSNGRLKRDLALTDQSKSTIPITLWGTMAENTEIKQFSIMAVRRAAVSQYLGKTTVNCNYNSLVLYNPDLEEATNLKDWFNAEMEKRNSQ